MLRFFIVYARGVNVTALLDDEFGFSNGSCRQLIFNKKSLKIVSLFGEVVEGLTDISDPHFFSILTQILGSGKKLDINFAF